MYAYLLGERLYKWLVGSGIFSYTHTFRSPESGTRTLSRPAPGYLMTCNYTQMTNSKQCNAPFMLQSLPKEP
jgi:hypothetical protein